ncbi:unnamed protein product [Blepharisma stoltei]|uniref:Uncharacterized protein n=1 Tax=Blepharisma stoltei TaxID=1481888 RepID=A0AAU9J5D8_9CILI|nr:unnamed protein product [Blepharisma stoltei]
MSGNNSHKSIDSISSQKGFLCVPSDTSATISISQNIPKYKLSKTYNSPNPTPVRGRRSVPQNKRQEKSIDTNIPKGLNDISNIYQDSNSYRSASSSQKSEKIDLLIDKYKKDINSQAQRMQYIKRNMQEYDQNIKGLLAHKAQDEEKRKILNETETKNKELKKRLKSLTESEEERVKSENKHLHGYLNDNLETKTKLESEIKLLKQANNELENLPQFPSQEELLHKNFELKQNYTQLSSSLKQLKEITISQEECNKIQNQLKDLEGMQNQLINENNNLKKELYQEQRQQIVGKDSAIQNRAYAREVALVKKELSLLKCLAKSIFTGQNVNLSFILGPGPITELEGKSISEGIQGVKEELSEIRQLVSEISTETSDKSCSIH